LERKRKEQGERDTLKGEDLHRKGVEEGTAQDVL
jgi:hypothetical protein